MVLCCWKVDIYIHQSYIALAIVFPQQATASHKSIQGEQTMLQRVRCTVHGNNSHGSYPRVYQADKRGLSSGVYRWALVMPRWLTWYSSCCSMIFCYCFLCIGISFVAKQISLGWGAHLGKILLWLNSKRGAVIQMPSSPQMTVTHQPLSLVYDVSRGFTWLHFARCRHHCSGEDLIVAESSCTSLLDPCVLQNQSKGLFRPKAYVFVEHRCWILSMGL